MAKLKSELSAKNQYYIPKHRYYELRHFCLQYPEWCAARNAVGCISSTDISGVSVKQNCSDPVARAVEMRLFYENRMNMIDRIAKETDPSLYSYIFKGVTEGLSYDILRARNGNRKLIKKRYEQKIDAVAAMMDAYIAYKRNKDAF